MKFVIDESNIDPRVFDPIINGKTRLNNARRKGAYYVGKDLMKHVISEINRKGRSGKQYIVYKGIGGAKLKRPRLHTASAPNEYPAVITGDFRKSIDFKVAGVSRLYFGAGANGLAKKYSRILELGSSKMQPRAPLKRTIETRQKNTKEILEKYLKNEMEKL